MAKVVDASNNNRIHDWRAVRKAGASAVWLKVSEGVGFLDATYRGYRLAAVMNGLQVGGYHFGHPSKSPEIQAEVFANSLILHPGDLLPVLDVEVTDGKAAGAVQQWVNRFCVELKRRKGVEPVIYSGDYFLRATLGGANGRRAWVASYGAKPRSRYDAWQFTDHGICGLDTSYAPSLVPLTFKPARHKKVVHHVVKPTEPIRRWLFQGHVIASRKSHTKL